MSNEWIKKLTGTWKLVSMTYKNEDGNESDFFGEDPVGYLMYDANGYMSAQFMMRERKMFETEGFASGTQDEIMEAFRSYQAYFGRFRPKKDEEYAVIHTVEGCIFPNWKGHEEIRYVQFENDFLILLTPPILIQDKEIVIHARWKKV